MGPAESAWSMDAMRQNLPPTAASPNWAGEFNPAIPSAIQAPTMNRPSAFDASDFARFQNASPDLAQQRSSSPMASSHLQNHMNPSGVMGLNSRMYGYQPMMMGAMNPQMAMRQSQQQQQDKGKGKLVELDDKQWEEQFAQLEKGDEQLDAEANAAIERELQGLDRSVDAESHGDSLQTETDHFGDFESIWRGIQAETQAARQLADDELFENGLGIDDWNGFDDLGMHGAEQPSVGDYLFEQHNPFQDRGDAVANDPFALGIEIMDSGGNLSLAALAFEAAVQKDPNHVDAWVRLGSAQAQNEKEIPAIRALEHASKLDPNNLEALMGLAVSYTNEGYDVSAYRSLERWVSIKYPQVVDGPASDQNELGFTQRMELQKKVTDMFIKAAQLSPSGDMMDPDVQVGLGVLFYGADEYEKAIDCFEAALASTEHGVSNQKQNRHLLWNRLGATMANSGRSEEAIEAYQNALDLRPNFVRARYNLGVSCINMSVYPEAAGHLLGALEMHRVDELEGRQKAREIVGGADGANNVSDGDIDRLIAQNQSTNLYDTLRRVFTQLGRRDLMDRVGPGMDPRQFRGEFDF